MKIEHLRSRIRRPLRWLAFLALAFFPAALSGHSSSRQDDLIVVGQDNWEKPWVPDLKTPDGKIEISADKRIDVLIMGDGYLAAERDQFEKEVKDWYDRFLTYTPWKQFRGAFRVRGLWTPSEGRATPEQKSHYKLPSTDSGIGRVGLETAAAIFDAFERAGANRAQARGQWTHAIGVMLIRNGKGRNPSGLTRAISAPGAKGSVRVAFGAYSHHEFGHAAAGVRDEYIRGPGSQAREKAPERLSLYSVSNISFTHDLKRLPWAHLAPGSELNPDKESVIGALWMGGGSEEGAWHSEAYCLMNGSHDNWNLEKTKRGKTLRDRDRFCFWCEELAVARTLEKTGQLGDSADGEALWKKWAEEVRPLYHKSFDVAARIKAKNEENAKANLSAAKIYERPRTP